MIQNINIARVSLITHGPVNALRTLDGVYIPRDDGVGPRDKQDAGTEGLTGFRESGGRRGGACLCAFKGSRTHCGVDESRVRSREAERPRWKSLPAAPATIMRRHNSSKIL